MFLVSVLVIGVIAAATALSLLLLGWAAEQNGLVLEESSQAFEYAQTCAERAFLALRQDAAYAGGETMTFERGTCRILPAGGSGNEDRFLCIEGESGQNTRRMELHIAKLLPMTTIEKWQEVAAFTLCL